MIDVTLQPFGRNLMMMGLAVMKHQALTNQKNAQAFNKEIANIKGLNQDNDLNEEVAFDVISNMLDKRFSSSKQFIGGEVPNKFNFKKTLSKEDKQIKLLVNKQAMKSRVRLNTAVSQYNKRLIEKQSRASFKLVNLKAVI